MFLLFPRAARILSLFLFAALGLALAFHGAASALAQAVAPNYTVVPGFAPRLGFTPVQAAYDTTTGTYLVLGERTLVRLTADGRRDARFQSPVFSGTYDFIQPKFEGGPARTLLVLPDGRILVGGWLTSVNGRPARYLVRLLPDGRMDRTFTNSQVVEPVTVLHSSARGGYYVGLAGSSFPLLLRFLDDGTWDRSFGAPYVPYAFVVALHEQPDRRLVVAARTYDFLPNGHGAVFRLEASGATDLRFGQVRSQLRGQTQGYVTAVSGTPDGRVLLGGNFDHLFRTGFHGEYTAQNIPFAASGLALIGDDGLPDIRFQTESFAPGIEPRPLGGAFYHDGHFVAWKAGVGLFTLNLDGTSDGEPRFILGGIQGVRHALLAPSGDILSVGDLTASDAPPRRSAALQRLPERAAFARFADSQPEVSETGGVATLVVKRHGATDVALTINYQTTGGLRAIAGVNFGPVAGTLVWPAGDTSDRSIVVPVYSDGSSEGDREFFVHLSTPPPTAYGTSHARIRLIDTDSAPVVVTQPVGGNHLAGDPLTLTVAATGLGPLGYQWYRDGAAIPAASQPVLAIAALSVADGGVYTVAVRNARGEVHSSPARVGVRSRPGSIVEGYGAADDYVPETIRRIVPLPGGGGVYVSGQLPGRRFLERRLTDGTRDPTFVAPFLYEGDGPLAVVRQPDGRLLVGGHLSLGNPHRTRALVRLEADGTLDTAFDEALGEGILHSDRLIYPRVNSVALLPDGRIAIAGRFNRIGATTSGVDHVAVLFPDGRLDSRFVSRAETEVQCVAASPDGEALFLGGLFNYESATCLARVRLDGSRDLAFGENSVGSATVLQLLFSRGGRLLVRGQNFPQPVNEATLNFRLGEQAPSLIEIAPATGALRRRLLAKSRTCSSVFASPDREALICGTRSYLSGNIRDELVLLDLSGDGGNGTPFSFDPPARTDSFITAVAEAGDGTAWFAGPYGAYLGEPAGGLIRIHLPVTGVRILAGPASRSALPGATVHLGVSADGEGLTYQWLKGEDPVPGANTPVLALPGFGSGDVADYTVLVTGGEPSVTLRSVSARLSLATEGPPPRLGIQEILFDAPTDRVFSATPITLDARATSGLPVSYAVVSGPGVVNGDELVLTGPGVVTLRATQAGGPAFAAATAVERAFTALQPEATITFLDLAPTYTAAPLAVQVATTPPGLAVQLHYDGSPYAPIHAGTYRVDAAITTPGAYGFGTATVTVGKAPLSVIAEATRLAGRPNPRFTLEFYGFLGQDTEAVLDRLPTAVSSAGVNAPPGDYPVRITGGRDNDYELFDAGGGLHVVGAIGPYEALILHPVTELPIGKMELRFAGSIASGRLVLENEPDPIPVFLNLRLSGGSAPDKPYVITAETFAYPIRFYAGLADGYRVQLFLGGAPELVIHDLRPASTRGFAPKLVSVQRLDLAPGQDAPFRGRYTVRLDAASPLGFVEPGPAGPGYATARIDAASRLALRGRLSDGTLVTASGAPDAFIIYRLFARPYGARAGSLLAGDFPLAGALGVSPYVGNYQPEPELIWQKPASPRHTVWRSGFGPLVVPVRARGWQAPIPATRFDPGLSLADILGLNSADVLGLASAFASPVLPARVRLVDGKLLLPVEPESQPGKFRGKINPATGEVTGTFVQTLPAPTSAAPDRVTTHVVPFAGVLHLERDFTRNDIPFSTITPMPPRALAEMVEPGGELSLEPAP